MRGSATALFPTSIVALSDIGLASNMVRAALDEDILAGTLVFDVDDATGIEVNMFLDLHSENGYEKIKVTGINGVELTVLRAQDGTSAVAHGRNTEVRATLAAKTINQLANEIIAIQTAILGTGGIPFGGDIILQAVAADAGNQLRDSPGLVLRGRYWNGAQSQNWDAKVYHDILTTGPTSIMRWQFNSVDKMTLTHDGILSVTTNIATPKVMAISGEVLLSSGDSTDYVGVDTSKLELVRNNTAMLYLTDGAISVMNGKPVVFLSDNGVTEQSRITPAAGNTTWLGASNVGISITAQGASGAVVLTSAASNDYISLANQIIRIGINNQQKMTISTSQFSIEQNLPVKFYTGAQVGQYANIQSTGLTIDAISAFTTNGTLTISRNGSGTVLIGAAGAESITVSSTNITYRHGGSGDHLFVDSSGNTLLRMGGLAGQIQVRHAYPLVFYSDGGTTEQSRITSAAGSTTWLGNSTSDIIIKAGTGGVVIGGATAADGWNILSSPDGTDQGAVSNGIFSFVMNSVNRARFTDTEFQLRNATSIILYNGDGTDERGRWDTTQLAIEIDDATGGATQKDSPIIKMIAKYWTGAASADLEAQIYNDVTGVGPQIVDLTFKNVAKTGLRIRYHSDPNVAIPILPDINTAGVAAANFTGGIVYDSTAPGGKVFWGSDGAAWKALD